MNMYRNRSCIDVGRRDIMAHYCYGVTVLVVVVVSPICIIICSCECVNSTMIQIESVSPDRMTDKSC